MDERIDTNQSNEEAPADSGSHARSVPSPSEIPKNRTEGSRFDDTDSYDQGQAEDDPLIGQMVGDYHILALLGSGGFGTVYKARDINLDRHAAIKFLRFQLDNEHRKRFLREAKVLANLSKHPSIVDIYTRSEHEGSYYFALEYLDDSVQGLLDENPDGLPLGKALSIVAQCCEALTYAHKQGVLHRDIKPANILIDKSSGDAKLCDFGLAKIQGLNPDSSTEVLAGTPAYMSPEQARGMEMDERSDIHSLGVTLFELLSGQLPYKGGSLLQTLELVKKDNGSPLSKFRPDLPEPILELVKRATARRPENRFQCAEDFGVAVESLMDPGQRPSNVADIRSTLQDAAADSNPNRSSETSRILTLVFTDLADSTRLKSSHGDSAVRSLIDRHRAHVTRLAELCDGRVIDWAGDGCFLTFETSTAGVLFCLRLQEVHFEETDLLSVRIGLHLGEVSESLGPDDDVRIEGLSVDLAARISNLAQPGQVLMSAAVYQSARQRLDADAFQRSVVWKSHGGYVLKGIEEAVDIGEAGFEDVSPMQAPHASDKARPISSSFMRRFDTVSGERRKVSSRVVLACGFVAFIALLLVFSDTLGLRSHLEIPAALAEANERLDKGEYSYAKDSYETYLAERPDDPRALYGLGYTLLFLGDMDGASAQFSEVSEEPLRVEGEAALAHAEQGEEARPTLEHAALVVPTRYPLVLIASLDVLGGDFGEAVARLKDLEPSGFNFNWQRDQYSSVLGQAYYKSGDFEKAQKILANITGASDGTIAQIAAVYMQMARQQLDDERRTAVSSQISRLKLMMDAEPPNKDEIDPWTSRPIRVWLPPADAGSSRRAAESGFADVFPWMLGEALVRDKTMPIGVVDRDLIGNVLFEQELAQLSQDGDSVKLGQLRGARLLVTTEFRRLFKEDSAWLRIVDTETTDLIPLERQPLQRMVDPETWVAGIADRIRDSISKTYPLRGRLTIDSDGPRINIGRDEGVRAGMRFSVLSGPDPSHAIPDHVAIVVSPVSADSSSVRLSGFPSDSIPEHGWYVQIIDETESAKTSSGDE